MLPGSRTLERFLPFSKEAFRLIFEDAGLIVDASEYTDQCMIIPPEEIVPYGFLEHWNREFPSYLLVRATGGGNRCYYSLPAQF